MKRKQTAIHEAGHAIMAHYSKAKIERISLSGGDGGVGIVWDTTKDDPGRGLLSICVLAAGSMADYLSSGDEAFWNANPKTLLVKSSDIETLKAFDFNKMSTRAQTRKLLQDLQTYLSDPMIFGKIHWLADELMDHPDGIDNLAIEIVRCQRQRTPVHDAAPLIEFLVDTLHAKN